MHHSSWMTISTWVYKLFTQLSSRTILGLLISLHLLLIFFPWVCRWKGVSLMQSKSWKIMYDQYIVFTLLKSLWFCPFTDCGEKVQICWIGGFWIFWYNDLLWSLILHIYVKIIELYIQIVRLRRGITIFILLNLFLNILSYIVY